MSSEALLGTAFYVSLVATILFLVEFGYLSVIAPLQRRRAVNRRLGVQMKSNSNEQALKLLKSERGVLDADVRLVRGLRRLLVHSGLRMGVTRFLVLVTAASGSTALALIVLTEFPAWACVPAGAALGILFPVFALMQIRNRRQQKFISQLPDGLDIIVRSLKSGHPIQTAMLYVGKEMPDPIGTEFGMTVDEMTFGIEVERALQNLSGRVGIPEISFLVTATSIQGKTGGNLAEVVEGLSSIFRERSQLRRKVRSLSSEARTSAIALTVIPVVIGLGTHLINPSYYGDVWHEPIFRLVLGGLIIWQVIGYLVMMKMINFKI